METSSADRAEPVASTLAPEQVLVRIRDVLYPPDTIESSEWSRGPVTICHDPYYNLEVALIGLERQGADRVCINTIQRVQEQISEVLHLLDAALGKRPSTEER